MIDWLRVFRSLLPDALAWRLPVGGKLRAFFEGLTAAPTQAKSDLDAQYLDQFPATTRVLPEWEREFALPSAGLTEAQRRARLDARWKATGGQSPAYLQSVIRAAGFDVYVHEWWVPSVEHPSGGSVNGDATPATRNPFDYLWDGSAPREFIGAGHDLAYCGGDSAFSNSQIDPPGYPLVNKIRRVESTSVGAGHDLAYCGGVFAVADVNVVVYSSKQYVMPADPQTYPYYLYIGGQSFPDVATVQGSRREEFEDLCLKYCPAEQWLGILVSYS